MPSIIIDYSENVLERPDDQLFRRIHEYLESTGEFQLSAMKSWARCQKDYYVVDGSADRAFVTCNIRILSGRDSEFKSQISQGVLQILQQFFFSSLRELKCDLTTYVSEIDKDSYHKAG